MYRHAEKIWKRRKTKTQTRKQNNRRIVSHSFLLGLDGRERICLGESTIYRIEVVEQSHQSFNKQRNKLAEI